MLAMEKIITTRQTIKATITNGRRQAVWGTSPGVDHHRRCQNSTIVVDEAMTESDELTALDLKDILSKIYGAEKVQYSIRTIARLQNDLGLTYTTIWYCQVIQEANKLKWLTWCKQRIDDKETFDDLIFIDECTIQLECHWRKCFWKIKMPRKLVYKHKHPPKIHVWGGIFKQGATQLLMFNGIMNVTMYGGILSASLLPFIKESLPKCHRLYQDNDPKHTSKYIQRFFESKHVNWWKSPAEIPDLNPIKRCGVQWRPTSGTSISRKT